MDTMTFLTREIDRATDLLGTNAIPVARRREIIDGEFELIVLKIDFRRAKDMLQAAGVRIVVRAS
jgi:hypothetical protein